MAKESTTTNIPRLSRIPLPGNFNRSPSTQMAAAHHQKTMKTNEKFANAQKRPASSAFLGVRQSQQLQQSTATTTQTNLKKSLSGDRLSRVAAACAMKRTNTEVKKFYGATTNAAQPTQKMSKISTTAAAPTSLKATKNLLTSIKNPITTTGVDVISNSPHTLTRSETFVRGDSQLDMLVVIHEVLLQSTPHDTKMQPNETTELLQNKNRHTLYTTQSLDATFKPSPKSGERRDSININININNNNNIDQSENDRRRTINLEQTHLLPGLSNTFDLNSPQLNCTRNVLEDASTTLLAEEQTENNTVMMMGAFSSTQLIEKLNNTSKQQLENNCDTTICSPATNATYSYPGSNEDLPKLEDISIPSGFNLDLTLQPQTACGGDRVDDDDDTKRCHSSGGSSSARSLLLTPNDRNGGGNKMIFNSTANTTTTTERLLDLTTTATPSTTKMATTPKPATRQMKLLNFTQDSVNAKRLNTTKLLYMSPQQPSSSAAMTPDRYYNSSFHNPTMTSMLKGAQSDLVLPIHTPDENIAEPMDLNATFTERRDQHHQQHYYQQQRKNENFCHAQGGFQQKQSPGAATSLQDVNIQNYSIQNSKPKSSFSFGFDLTDSTLDCSIELIDVSLSPTGQSHHGMMHAASTHTMNKLSHAFSSSQLLQQQQLQQPQQQSLLLKKQFSFEKDESLGILTPDQMKEFLDSTTTNTNNLDLPLDLNSGGGMAACFNNNNNNNQNSINNPGGIKNSLQQQMRIDQTPSPEELPLDPVGVKTDCSMTDLSQPTTQQSPFYHIQRQQQQQEQQQPLQEEQHLQQSHSLNTEPISLNHTDTEYSKTDQMMMKSNVSKISTSFITSVTSVTSLDTGYQGDGEMSRPASRGPSDHSPSNGPMIRKGGGGHVSRQPSFNQPLPIRRQDPMTDSDFFTESDADDVLHHYHHHHNYRGDRRAQVIDGQLYGPGTAMMQSAAFISEDPQMEDSCMESSGIFTDVENRCDEDLTQMRRQATQDLTPDGNDDSTGTVKGRNDMESNTTNTTTTINNIDENTGMVSASSSAVNVNAESFMSMEDEEEEGAFITAETAGKMKMKRFESFPPNAGESFCHDDDHQQTTVQKQLLPRKHDSVNSLVVGNGNSNSNGTDSANKLLTTTTTTTTPSSSLSTSATSATSFSLSGNNVSGNNGSKRSLNEKSSAIKSNENPSLNAKIKNGVNNNKVTTSTRVTPSKTKLNQNSISKSSPANNGVGQLVRKTNTPNKWDAVMNKIANSKALGKKNYNDVKSKVSTTRLITQTTTTTPTVNVVGEAGVSGGTTSPANTGNKVRRSTSSVSSSVGSSQPQSPVVANKLNIASSNASSTPTMSGGGGSGVMLQSPHTKRLLQSAAIKRGRSYSKDSQKSSQSDLSLTSGSPKLLVKTPLRAAKKRDVRNLSISPTDLGPPPKTQQTAKGASTRQKPSVTTAVTLTQKRLNTSNGTTTTTPSSSAASTGNVKSNSPTLRKSTSLSSNTKTNVTVVKSLAKEPNRYSQQQQSQAASPSPSHHNNGTPIQSKSSSGIKTDAVVTPNNKNGITTNGLIVHNNNNNNNTNNHYFSNGTATSTVDKSSSASSLRTNPSQSPSPILGHHAKKIAKTTTTTSSTPPPPPQLDKKSQSKGFSPRKLLTKKLQQHSTETHPTATAATCDFILDADELQRLKYLNRHSCNGRLDYESLDRHLQQAERLSQNQNRGVEAMAVMLKYLVEDLDAFACPAAKLNGAKAKDALSKTLNLLEEAKVAFTELQEQLLDKEAYYAKREEDLQTLHRCELEKAQSNLLECQMYAQDQIRSIEVKLLAKQDELSKALEREQELQERLSSLEITEQQLRDKLKEGDTYVAELQTAAAEREQALNERIRFLSRDLEKLRANNEHNERQLTDRLTLSQDEIAILRSSSNRSFNEINPELNRSTSSQRSSNASSAVSMEISRLHSEAESLRCVLELKQKEISKLTKQNEELLRDAEERNALQGKLSLVESNNEMLTSEINIKALKEKEYVKKIDELEKVLSHESTKRVRLSYDNEALQWQLKQRSEQLHLVEAKLQESLNGTSTTIANTSASFNRSSPNRSSLINSSTSLVNNMTATTINGSPPTSPLIKGVIEKTDSVSWVLEMDDETPESAASKIVKRAASFRSVERNPSVRRQVSMGATVAPTSITINDGAGPNPLAQSMSATSVIRQHSSELDRAQARSRSKSMSKKDTESTTSSTMLKQNGRKALNRLSSSSKISRKLEPVPSWQEPLQTSSPYNGGMRPRTSTMKTETNDYCRSTNSPTSIGTTKLITCDTSALNSGERLEIRSLPSQQSMHDLKVLKKCQEIQESAGEAMVSGTNSEEDDGCSASSDEIVSTVSTTSSAHSNMSLEEVLMLEKMGSFSGTPMEMSWSDEAEVFGTNSSTV